METYEVVFMPDVNVNRGSRCIVQSTSAAGAAAHVSKRFEEITVIAVYLRTRIPKELWKKD